MHRPRPLRGSVGGSRGRHAPDRVPGARGGDGASESAARCGTAAGSSPRARSTSRTPAGRCRPARTRVDGGGLGRARRGVGQRARALPYRPRRMDARMDPPRPRATTRRSPVPARATTRRQRRVLRRLLRRAPTCGGAFELRSAGARAMLYATARGVLEWSSTARASATPCSRPAGPTTASASSTRRTMSPSCLRPARTCSARSSATAGTRAIVGFDPQRRGNHYGREPELLCELHVEYEDGSVEIDRHRRALARHDRPARLLGPADGRALRRARASSGRGQPVDAMAVTCARDGVRLVPERAQPIRVTEELEPVAIVRARPGRARRRPRPEHGRLGAAARSRARAARRSGCASPRCSSRTARSTRQPAQRAAGRHVRAPWRRAGGLRAALHLPRLPLRRGHRPAGRPVAETITGPRRALRHARRAASSNAPTRWSTSSGATSSGASAATSSPSRPTARSATSGSAGSATPRSSSPPPRSTWTSPPSSPSGATTCSTRSPPTGAFPDVAPRCVRRARRRARVGRRRRHRPVDAVAPLRRPPPPRAPLGRDGALHGLPPAPQPRPAVAARRGNDYGDWLVGRRRARPRDVLATAYWAYDARADGRAWPGRSARAERAEHYERLRAGIAAAFNRAYVGDDACIEGDTQTVYLLALHMDLLPDELAPARPPSGSSRTSSATTGHLTTGLRRRRAAVPGAERDGLQRRRVPAAAQRDLPVLGLLDPPRRDDDLGALGRLDRGRRLPDARR